MFCLRCQNDFSECTCGDLHERIAAVAHGGHFAYRACKKCGLHYSKCRCDEPDWIMTLVDKTSTGLGEPYDGS